MTVGKSVFRWLGLAMMVTLLVLGCEGDDGPMGPPGFRGDQGDPGDNRTPDPIVDQTFGILINNLTETDFQGALAVQLTSDEAASPSASRVVARELVQVPILDGVDGGASEWGGAEAADIDLVSVQGNDLGITSVSVRVGYNFENVYMQFKWTEAEHGSFVSAPDTTKNLWRANSATSWVQSGGEDRVHIFWEIGDVTGWDNDGVAAIFDGSDFETPAEGEMVDMWTWGSTISYYGQFLQDQVVRDSDAGGDMIDVGEQYVIENDGSNNVPSFMRTNSSLSGSSYPLRDFEYTNFNSNLNWRQGATIPGYIHFEPSRSTADVLAVGKFENGTWTVELQRRRNTGQSDDALF